MEPETQAVPMRCIPRRVRTRWDGRTVKRVNAARQAHPRRSVMRAARGCARPTVFFRLENYPSALCPLSFARRAPHFSP